MSRLHRGRRPGLGRALRLVRRQRHPGRRRRRAARGRHARLHRAGARSSLDDVRRLGVGPVTAVVNTHEHFDHTFGNATFVEAVPRDLPIHATEEARRSFLDWAEGVRALGRGRGQRRPAPRGDPGHRAGRCPTPPSRRPRVARPRRPRVELRPPRPGPHRRRPGRRACPTSTCVLAGDLVEESGPPYFGADAWPLEWPLTARDLVLGLMLTSDTVVVPGHGTPVDRDFVQAQRARARVRSPRTIRDLAAQGVPDRRGARRRASGPGRGSTSRRPSPSATPSCLRRRGGSRWSDWARPGAPSPPLPPSPPSVGRRDDVPADPACRDRPDPGPRPLRRRRARR